jgi:hypothetical protein
MPDVLGEVHEMDSPVPDRCVGELVFGVRRQRAV